MRVQAARRTGGNVGLPIPVLAVGLGFWSAVGVGCSGGSDSGSVDEVREVDRPASVAVGASSDERFGFSGHHPGDGHDHGDPHGGSNPHAGGGAPAASTSGIEFTWALPEGWQELDPSSLRNANFRVAGDPNSECYLTLLPGGAGGVVANVNRWRGQLGLEPLSEQQIQALPRKILLRGEAVFVDMQGDFRGMGTEAKPDYRMAGLILEAPSATVFLKMVGPSAVVGGEIQSFLDLGASFDVKQPNAPAASANGTQGLFWATPDGWVRGRDRSMRLVTFSPGGSADTECYITVLPGEAGGLSANLNRWRSQMGQPALSLDEIGALERREVLGAEGVFIEIDGDFTGMSGGTTQGAGFLGMVCRVGDGTLFVKMTGPASAVGAERDNFFAFCESLNTEGS